MTDAEDETQMFSVRRRL